MAHTTPSPDDSTPGKPKDHASRQQKHPHQGTQTGSKDLDQRTPAPNRGGATAPRPPNAK